MPEISNIPSQPLAEWTGGNRVTLAIVFTDIVGSTALGVELADEKMNEVRLAHFAHSRVLLSQHAGREIKTIGDSVMAVFRSVGAALDYAHGLHFDPGHAELRTRGVRAGVHIGAVDVIENDIFGTEVAVAARIVHTIKGAEIWISDQAKQDIARAGSRRHLDLEWQPHDSVELKGLGAAKLWSLAAVPHSLSHRVPKADMGNRDHLVINEASLGPPNVIPLALPNKPSIAVLPFANMSGDPEQEYFADGIAEDIITLLSKSRGLFVIARNSTFTYKGRAVDIKQVGSELGVRYVLEGSVRKAGDRVRVTGQLIEAATGGHLWAQRYDRDITDIFAVQDEITDSVSAAILPTMQRSERERAARKPPDNLDAWECYHRGLWHYAKIEPAENARARDFFQRAIELDPNFAAAYSGIAITEVTEVTLFRSPNLRREILPGALEHARHSVAIDPSDEIGHSVLAHVLVLLGRHQEALAEAELAVSLGPSSAWALGALGYAQAFGGLPREGIDTLKTAMRFSPFDPLMSRWQNHLGRAYYFIGDSETAIAIARELCRTHPNYRPAYRTLLAALGHAGHVMEARSLMSHALNRFGDDLTVAIETKLPELRDEDYDRMLDGYRKAGVFET